MLRSESAHSHAPSASVSKHGQQTRCGLPPFETRPCGPLLRVRCFCLARKDSRCELSSLGARKDELARPECALGSHEVDLVALADRGHLRHVARIVLHLAIDLLEEGLGM